MHVSLAVEMCPLKAGEGGTSHNELRTLECFSLKEIDKGLYDEIFLVLDGSPENSPGTSMIAKPG